MLKIVRQKLLGNAMLVSWYQLANAKPPEAIVVFEQAMERLPEIAKFFEDLGEGRPPQLKPIRSFDPSLGWDEALKAAAAIGAQESEDQRAAIKKAADLLRRAGAEPRRFFDSLPTPAQACDHALWMAEALLTGQVVHSPERRARVLGFIDAVLWTHVGLGPTLLESSEALTLAQPHTLVIPAEAGGDSALWFDRTALLNGRAAREVTNWIARRSNPVLTDGEYTYLLKMPERYALAFVGSFRRGMSLTTITDESWDCVVKVTQINLPEDSRPDRIETAVEGSNSDLIQLCQLLLLLLAQREFDSKKMESRKDSD